MQIPEATSPPADSGIKSNRPKSQVGFGMGISLGDLNRDKLKKTGKVTQPPPPSAQNEIPKVELKVSTKIQCLHFFSYFGFITFSSV